MRRILYLRFLAVLIGVFFAVESAQAEAPVQIAVINPVQIVNENDSVKGMRVNLIYGANENVSGADLGMINQVNTFMSGIQAGLFNNSYDMTGVQFGIVNITEMLKGLQIGLLNFNKNEDPYGFLPLLNYSF